MKYTKSFTLLFVVVCFTAQATKAQVSSPDTIIHKLFATLKAKDEKAFVGLYPNGPQFAKMMRQMMEGMLNSEQMKQMMAMDPKSKDINIDSLINTEVDKMSKPEVFADVQKSISRKFQEAIENGEKKGVNWSMAKLVTYTTDTTGALNNEMKMFESSGLKNMSGIIDFTAGDSAYRMSFDKLFYIPAEGGWFGGEFEQVIRKGESFTANGETEDTTITVSTERMPPPPPPPPPAKPKTKTKSIASPSPTLIRTSPTGIKTKPKTTSPARKPTTKS